MIPHNELYIVVSDGENGRLRIWEVMKAPRDLDKAVVAAQARTANALDGQQHYVVKYTLDSLVYPVSKE